MIVNAYFQSRVGERSRRPAERAQWDFLLEEADGPCIVAGGFNAHSLVWNLRRLERRYARFLEDLIDSFSLTALNDGSRTRWRGQAHSIVDLTLASPSAVEHCLGWRSLGLGEGLGRTMLPSSGGGRTGPGKRRQVED